MTDIRHIVNYSGGLTSWAAAKRVKEKHGTDGLVLLFADTNAEDQDLYRFLKDSARNIGVDVTRIADGRTPWEVQRDEKIIGNSRIDPCSKILKRNLLDRWHKENADPEIATIYIGMDWTEVGRLGTVRSRLSPWRVEAPLTEPLYLSKRDIAAMCREQGFEPPSLYALGFPHNNCAGACIKAGQAQWALLLQTNRPLYLEKEQWEQEMREMVGDHSILKDRRGGNTKPLTLRKFRQRIEGGGEQDLFDAHEWGGCGCAL